MAVSLSVKNVPDDVAERLRARAKRNRRSLQGELLVILESAARPALSVADAAQRIRELGLPPGPDESTEIIRHMRDTR